MSNPMENLTPEMQARLAAIMAGQQQAPAESPHQAAIAQPQAAPVAKPPSLMDHIIALRQEVAVLRQSVAANSDVVEAVGQAVGQLYQMFQPSTQGPPQGSTYSQSFQQQAVDDSDY